MVTLGQLLKVFFSVVRDPTQLKIRPSSTGTGSRSAIFFGSPEQGTNHKAYIGQLTQAKIYYVPMVTQVIALNGFYPAESYHQDYAERRPQNPYIQMSIFRRSMILPSGSDVRCQALRRRKRGAGKRRAARRRRPFEDLVDEARQNCSSVVLVLPAPALEAGLVVSEVLTFTVAAFTG